MCYLLQILFREKQSWNAKFKVQSIKWAGFSSSWSVPRLVGACSGLCPAILVPDRADCPKIDLDVACATLTLGFPNLWNLVGGIWGVACTCPEWSRRLAIAVTLIKEFDWRFFDLFLVLTMKFLSFWDSFFIVNKLAEKRFYDHPAARKIQTTNFFTWVDCWSESLSIELYKQVVTVEKFREIQAALGSLSFWALI